MAKLATVQRVPERHRKQGLVRQEKQSTNFWPKERRHEVA